MNICTICYNKGHTAKYCTSTTIDTKVHVIAKLTDQADRVRDEMEDLDDNDPKLKVFSDLLHEQLDIEVQRLRKMMASSIMNGECHGKCKYCTTLPNYNHHDLFMNNHYTSECPRIALFTCKYCKGRGHNEGHCKKKRADKTPFMFGRPDTYAKIPLGRLGRWDKTEDTDDAIDIDWNFKKDEDDGNDGNDGNDGDDETGENKNKNKNKDKNKNKNKRSPKRKARPVDPEYFRTYEIDWSIFEPENIEIAKKAKIEEVKDAADVSGIFASMRV
jgi:hypothetical protein